MSFRVAIIGIDHPHGAGWRRALEGLAGEVEVATIVPRYDGGLASLEERYAELPRYESVDALLEALAGREVQFDGALVCLPNNESPAAATALARAGRHVLVEKPLAATAAELAPLVEAVDEQGVAFQSGYLWRYDEAARRLREMVAQGRFGPLTSIEMSMVTSDVRRRGPEHYLFDPAYSGGGFFNWLACHWIDLLFYITGQAVVAVTARVGQFGATNVEVEDGGTAILELAEGALVTLVGGYWLPRWAGESHWCLRGRDRWVHWQPASKQHGGVLEIHGPQPQWDAMDETFRLPADATPGYGGAPAAALIRDWIASAAAPAARRCRNTPRSAAATLAVIDAIYESSRTGRRTVCAIEPA